MATCPECGGRLFPVRPAAIAVPREAVRCRWCRALLGIPWLGRAAVLAVAGAGLVAAGLLLPGAARELIVPLRVALLAGVPAGVLLAAWLVGSCLPLVTLRPRDYRDWGAASGESARQAEREVS